MTALWAICLLLQEETVKVGSKQFPESHLLGEIIAQIVEDTKEAGAERKFGLGSTAVAFGMLKSGDLDIYPEYTGTISQVILKADANLTTEEINERLRESGLAVSESLGFNNTYAIAVPAALARERGLRTLSDLRKHPDLKVAVTHEFLGRKDGWRPMAQRYRLRFDTDVVGMQHKMAYAAIQAGRIQVMDAYSTDAELQKYNLTVLEDDLKFFPEYFCVLIYRADLPQRVPKTFRRLMDRLQGRMNEASMIDLNSQVVFEKRRYEDVAAGFLGLAAGGEENQFWRWTGEHFMFVSLSVFACIAIGLPLGILGSRLPLFGQASLLVVGVGYTVPSLALFGLLIRLKLGMTVTVLIGLVLAGLLPIVRNTYTALRSIDPTLLEAAEALGLSPMERLLRVELPLASRMILAGIKLTAVISVGTATIAAYLGVGGYGQPIFEGISLEDKEMILRGAIPAAGMALLATAFFELLDRFLIPRGLRLAESRT